MLRDDKLVLSKAIVLAVQAHAGQADKAGESYIFHPLRVMLRMTDDLARMTAVLHDVLEDTPITADELRREGIPQEVIAAVACLTRRQSESYAEFIERIKPNPLARIVKCADLEDNLDASRLRTLTQADLKRMDNYRQALATLQA